ncbi:MAG: hypothetical protein ABIK91_06195, partial [Pseudomonadota bacterium]
MIETEAPVACACDGGLFIWRRCNLNGVNGFEMGCDKISLTHKAARRILPPQKSKFLSIQSINSINVSGLPHFSL